VSAISDRARSILTLIESDTLVVIDVSSALNGALNAVVIIDSTHDNLTPQCEV
jgi:hypothetical protein